MKDFVKYLNTHKTPILFDNLHNRTKLHKKTQFVNINLAGKKGRAEVALTKTIATQVDKEFTIKPTKKKVIIKLLLPTKSQPNMKAKDAVNDFGKKLKEKAENKRGSNEPVSKVKKCFSSFELLPKLVNNKAEKYRFVRLSLIKKNKVRIRKVLDKRTVNLKLTSSFTELDFPKNS